MRTLRTALIFTGVILGSLLQEVDALGPDSGLTGLCKQPQGMAAFDGDFLAMIQGAYGQLGQYDNCVSQGTYCKLNLMFHCVLEGRTAEIASPSICGSTQPHVPTLSVCVPSTCTTEELNRQLQSQELIGATWWNALLQEVFNRDLLPFSSCLTPEALFCSLNGSFTYFQAECMTPSGNRDRDDWHSSEGAFAAVCVAGVIVVLCGVATLVAAIRSIAEGLYMMLRSPAKAVDDDRPSSADESSMAVPILGHSVNTGDGKTPSSSRANTTNTARPGLAARLLGVLNHFNVVDNFLELITIVPRHSAAVDTRWMEGLRVISMCFVVYGHTLYFPQTAFPFVNAADGYKFARSYQGVGVYPAMLAVDAFFFMSGYLFLYLYFNQVEKVFKKAVSTHRLVMESEGQVQKVTDDEDDRTPRLRPVGVIDTLFMYLHRYLRIAPVVGFVMLCTIYAIPLIPDGPLHAVTKQLAVQCTIDGGWWRTLLFFQNIRPQDILCMSWFWYLSCDFQMFLIAPIVCAIRFLRLEDLVWFSHGWKGSARGLEQQFPWLKNAGHVLFYVTCLTFLAISIEITGRLETYNSQYYSRSIARAAPYAYGFLASALIREPWVRARLDDGRVRFALYAVGTVLLLFCVNMLWKSESEFLGSQLSGGQPPSHVLTYGSQGSAMAFWGLALGLFSLAWGSGNGGPLARFLGHPLLAVISKLTFCSYMLHPIVIITFWSGERALPVWTVASFYGFYAAFLTWTFLSATLLHVALEVPAAKLNNALTKRR